MSGYPVRITVKVDFSDGSTHEYEVGNAHLTAPNEARAAEGLPQEEILPPQQPVRFIEYGRRRLDVLPPRPHDETGG
jgi:hypothetical protein